MSRFHSKLVIVVAAAIALSSSVGCSKQENKETRSLEFRADGELAFRTEDGGLLTRIAIEIADSEEAQAIGLMGRTSLPARGGMLFPYDEEDMRSFWMKNTPLPLDIIFIREDSTIANIVARTRPFSEDQIKSTEPAIAVLEVRAGFTDQYGINTSSRIEWKRRTD